MCRNIYSYYPDCGELRYKLLYNRLVQPHQHVKKGVIEDDFHILFCYEGTIKPGETFQHNHFAPLIFHQHQEKRKSAVQSRVSATTTKKEKVSSSTISDFFTLAPKIKGITTDPKSSKAPKENFSSSAQLAAHKLSGNSTPSTSTMGTSLQLTSKVKIEEVKHDFTNNYDVSLFRDKVKGMDTSQIFNLVTNVYKPDKQYSFPKTNCRSFRYDWLKIIFLALLFTL